MILAVSGSLCCYQARIIDASRRKKTKMAKLKKKLIDVSADHAAIAEPLR